MSRIGSWQRSPPFLALVALSVALLGLKSPDAISLPQFWAEDGLVWFWDQLGRSWPQVELPYGGYLHFWPRMTAWVAHLFPLRDAPLVSNGIALVTSAVAISLATRRAAPSLGFWAVFLSFFILPTGGELFGTITNVQWFGQVAMAAMCFLPDRLEHHRLRCWRLLSHAFLLSLALSGPFSALIVAITGGVLVLRWASRSWSETALGRAVAALWDTISWPEAGIVMIGAALQGVVLALTKVQPDSPSLLFLTADQLAQLGMPARSSLIVYLTYAYASPISLVLGGCMAVAVLVAGVLILRGSRLLPVGLLLVLGMAVLEPAAAIVRYRHSHMELTALTAASRYYYLLGVVSIWIYGRLLFGRPWRGRWGVAVLSVGAVVAFASMRPEYLIRPRLADFHWPHYAAEIAAGAGNVVVPINPAGWAIEIPPSRRGPLATDPG